MAIVQGVDVSDGISLFLIFDDYFQFGSLVAISRNQSQSVAIIFLLIHLANPVKTTFGTHPFGMILIEPDAVFDFHGFRCPLVGTLFRMYAVKYVKHFVLAIFNTAGKNPGFRGFGFVLFRFRFRENMPAVGTDFDRRMHDQLTVGTFPHAYHQMTTETSFPEIAPVILETATNNASQITETTTIGTGAAATAVSSMPSILMAVAMPFVWVMSVLLGGQACGLALVYHTPTIPLRRWLVKHLFYCYCAIVIAPFVFLTGGWMMYHVHGFESRSIFTFVYNTCLILTVFVYLLVTNRKYRKIWNGKITVITHFESLNQLIRKGFVGLAVILLVFFLIFVKMSILPSYQVSAASGEYDKCVFIAVTAFALIGVMTCIHTSMFFLFRYYLTISTDDSAVYSAPTKKDSLSYCLLWEIAYMTIFVILTLTPSLLHLFLKNTRPVCAIMELVGFSLCWGVVLSLNLKKPGYRWRLIISVFIVLVTIMATLRLTIYE